MGDSEGPDIGASHLQVWIDFGRPLAQVPFMTLITHFCN